MSNISENMIFELVEKGRLNHFEGLASIFVERYNMLQTLKNGVIETGSLISDAERDMLINCIDQLPKIPEPIKDAWRKYQNILCGMHAANMV